MNLALPATVGTAGLADELAAIAGRAYVIAPGDDRQPYPVGWRDRCHGHAAAARAAQERPICRETIERSGASADRCGDGRALSPAAARGALSSCRA